MNYQKNTTNDYDNAYVKRPFLSLFVISIWIAIIILIIMSFNELIFSNLKNALKLFLYSLILFCIWLPIHKWAIKNPKK